MKSAKRARTGYRSCFLLTNGTTASTRPAAVKRKTPLATQAIDTSLKAKKRPG
ncbi:MAG: hypothetical protein WCI23_09780 [Chlorobiaceae bacterium]